MRERSGAKSRETENRQVNYGRIFDTATTATNSRCVHSRFDESITSGK